LLRFLKEWEMDSSYITPFIRSTQSVFDTMLHTPVTPAKPMAVQSLPARPGSDVSAIIGMSGDMVGTVVLGFPHETALKAVHAFTGANAEFGSDDFTDAIGELVNMVSGAAKAQLTGKNVSISCPSVVMGPDHKIQQPSNSVCICIPYSSPLGEFTVEVAIRKDSKTNPEVALTAAGARR
jgi:chemotaxis protein CheX